MFCRERRESKEMIESSERNRLNLKMLKIRKLQCGGEKRDRENMRNRESQIERDTDIQKYYERDMQKGALCAIFQIPFALVNQSHFLS